MVLCLNQHREISFRLLGFSSLAASACVHILTTSLSERCVCTACAIPSLPDVASVASHLRLGTPHFPTLAKTCWGLLSHFSVARPPLHHERQITVPHPAPPSPPPHPNPTESDAVRQTQHHYTSPFHSAHLSFNEPNPFYSASAAAGGQNGVMPNHYENWRTEAIVGMRSKKNELCGRRLGEGRGGAMPPSIPRQRQPHRVAV